MEHQNDLSTLGYNSAANNTSMMNATIGSIQGSEAFNLLTEEADQIISNLGSVDSKTAMVFDKRLSKEDQLTVFGITLRSTLLASEHRKPYFANAIDNLRKDFLEDTGLCLFRMAEYFGFENEKHMLRSEQMEEYVSIQTDSNKEFFFRGQRFDNEYLDQLLSDQLDGQLSRRKFDLRRDNEYHARLEMACNDPEVLENKLRFLEIVGELNGYECPIDYQRVQARYEEKFKMKLNKENCKQLFKIKEAKKFLKDIFVEDLVTHNREETGGMQVQLKAPFEELKEKYAKLNAARISNADRQAKTLKETDRIENPHKYKKFNDKNRPFTKTKPDREPLPQAQDFHPEAPPPSKSKFTSAHSGAKFSDDEDFSGDEEDHNEKQAEVEKDVTVTVKKTTTETVKVAEDKNYAVDVKKKTIKKVTASTASNEINGKRYTAADPNAVFSGDEEDDEEEEEVRKPRIHIPTNFGAVNTKNFVPIQGQCDDMNDAFSEEEEPNTTTSSESKNNVSSESNKSSCVAGPMDDATFTVPQPTKVPGQKRYPSMILSDNCNFTKPATPFIVQQPTQTNCYTNKDQRSPPSISDNGSSSTVTASYGKPRTNSSGDHPQRLPSQNLPDSNYPSIATCRSTPSVCSNKTAISKKLKASEFEVCSFIRGMLAMSDANPLYIQTVLEKVKKYLPHNFFVNSYSDDVLMKKMKMLSFVNVIGDHYIIYKS